MRDRRKRRIVASGYYGCGNAGDEAVLAGIKQALDEVGAGSVELIALSQDPPATRALHGIEARHRMRLGEMLGALRGCDLLISGGGSLLQDTTSFQSLLYYLAVIGAALLLRRPVMFYAQGMGPFRTWLGRRLVSILANKAAYITVRDRPSEEVLRTIGVGRPPIEVTADPAFALNPSRQPASQSLWRAGVRPAESGPKIGMALRRWGRDEPAQIDAYAKLITAIELQTGGQVCMIPMQPPADMQISEAVLSRAGISRPIVRNGCSPADLLAIVEQMDCVVAMRLHALIFAARVAVPPFALSYDPKVDNLMEALGLAGSMAPWSGFDPDRVAAQVASSLSGRDALAETLSSGAARLKSLAHRNAEIALALASGADVQPAAGRS